MQQLAIDGGTPVRSEQIFYGRQWIDEEDIAAVAEVMRSDFITCGPKVAEAEQVLCAYTGAKHAVVVNSGTAALHAAVFAAGIGEGDEVITTPLTFMASANCALYAGAKPVFADIDPETYQIDPALIEARITKKTKAVVAVDYAGEVVDAARIRDICDRHHLVFIEDAAHAIGSKHNGRPTGSYADLTCFSFHPVKTVTSGEGGAVLTNDDAYAKRALLFRSHGIERDMGGIAERLYDDTTEVTKERMHYVTDQVFLGYNYRMPDINAALLLSQMKKLERFIARRKEIVERYDEAFKDLPQIALQKSPAYSDAARHLYTIRLVPEKLSCGRAKFFAAMEAENVVCQVHYMPTHLFSHYQAMGYQKGSCPVAERTYAQLMSVPLYPMLTEDDVSDVIRAVRKVASFYAV
ncbi:MAG: UDP-4-amino-4,6-dideoxy-N-acetyl-beta-L-altrosamine transaminase [Lachnospiraceae bacterium]|nr:UDP-4-amino-4,6-dideoxy-N-acetyl-beta-L-altrosamine transaminase [Lachnospiraceae bacterium]